MEDAEDDPEPKNPSSEESEDSKDVYFVSLTLPSLSFFLPVITIFGYYFFLQ